MLIEQTTTYAYKLKYLDNPSFDKVKNLAKKFIDELPQELVDDLYNSINRGVDILKTEPEMLVYLYSFGNMHQAKLNKAFENIPEILFDQPEINIIDYGCGQSIGTMCYVDFIRQKGISQNVKRVTLIEPSEICLKRAALHVSAFCSDAEIVTINKTFDDLDAADIVCDEEIPTLHILSNVLDLEFDLERFAELISDNLKGYNQFVCVGPYFGFSDKDKRMENLYLLLNGGENFCQYFDKYELNPNRPWTAQIKCFSNGELEEELSTEVTDEDIADGVVDEFGVVYSRDGKRLLRCDSNEKITKYEIKKGTKVICDKAFSSFSFTNNIQTIIIPETITTIGVNPFQNCIFRKCSNIKLVNQSSFFLIKDEFLIDKKHSVIVSYIGNNENIYIPHYVTTIGDFAFAHCVSLKYINIPNSITSIGNYAFRGCYSLRQIIISNSVTFIGVNPFTNLINPLDGTFNFDLITKSSRFVVVDGVLIDTQCNSIIACITNKESVVIPDSITTIGDSAFAGHVMLKQVYIPNSVTTIGDNAFGGCVSLEQIYIPNSVITIGTGAFYCCVSLRQIYIPNSITEVGNDTFRCCFALLQIIIEDCNIDKIKQMLSKKYWNKLFYIKSVEKKTNKLTATNYEL